MQDRYIMSTSGRPQHLLHFESLRVNPPQSSIACVPGFQGLRQPRPLVRQGILLLSFFTYKSYNHIRCCIINHIVSSHDIESNPGPRMEILSNNVRGLKEKTKRILNYMHKILRAEIGIAFIQETHTSTTENKKLDL